MISIEVRVLRVRVAAPPNGGPLRGPPLGVEILASRTVFVMRAPGVSAEEWDRGRWIPAREA